MKVRTKTGVDCEDCKVVEEILSRDFFDLRRIKSKWDWAIRHLESHAEKK